MTRPWRQRLRALGKRVRGFQSSMVLPWWSIFRLRPLPFALATLRGARLGGVITSTPVEAYEEAKGHRVERERTERLLRLFASIQGFVPAAARLLDVGPRSLAEPLLLRLYGFSHITAIDLVPKHPSIRRGDMHALPFADATFDVVYCAFTVTYGTPARALAEFRRVLRPGGLLALAWGTATPTRIIQTPAGPFTAAPLSPDEARAAFAPSHLYWHDSAVWPGGGTHYLLMRK